MDWTLISPALLWPVAIGYLLGSVPFGLVLTRAFGAGDLRSIGSGSIGATNVLRTGRKGLAAATLLLDAAKGGVAVVIAEQLAPGAGPMAAGAALIGHCYPVWLRFRGGKGVATALGIILAVSWPIALALLGVWAVAIAVSRISSLSSLSAVVAAIPAALLLGSPALVPLMAAMALVIVWKHRANITRLMNGTEPRIGGAKADAPNGG
ncbi:MAG: acyl-phosphate glycerol 3-phosphate acyltransferase [Sphingomonas sp.]|nr:acyl-phosphate glycerol 3-phosphate acyltransferase [Sphingomonas sp.]